MKIKKQKKVFAILLENFNFANFNSVFVFSFLYIEGYFTTEYSETLHSNFLTSNLVEPRCYWERF